jgi:hypothetical protein
LIIKAFLFQEWFIDPLIPVGPSIEKDEDNGEKFLQDDPYEILKSGNYWGKNVPIIVGVNSHEGLMHSWGEILFFGNIYLSKKVSFLFRYRTSSNTCPNLDNGMA